MKEILITSIGFSPNLGGIETHFDDLVSALARRNWKIYVLTYKPITTDAKALIFERRGKNISIFRIPWFGKVFYKLVKRPFFEFIYLTPGLFVALPIFLILKGSNIKVIHSHGLIAGMVSVFWGKIFGKKIISTTHSIYNFPQSGFYRNLARLIFSSSNLILTLSRQSKAEIEGLGIPKEKIRVFTYWVDLKKFDVKGSKLEVRKKLGIEAEFMVFCASRLVPEKGIRELLKAASIWDKKIFLVVSSVGPLKSLVEKYARKFRNISYVGGLSQDEMALYFSASDLLIVPSTHEEGFGRVILESLACGTPVIGSNRGAIPEAMDDTVGKLIDVRPDSIKETVEYFYKNPTELKKLSRNTRNYAVRHYSEANIKKIVESYSFR